MGKYVVKITETLSTNVEVEANSPEEAEQIVADEYHDSKHILTSEDFVDVDFKAKEPESSKIKVILLEPNKIARVAEIDASLEGMQSIVNGLIERGFYFEDPVCIVVNEEGKMIGLDLNRGVYDKDNKLIDIIAGTAFICDCSGKKFGSLSEEQIKKYIEIFKYPERFFKICDEITGVKYNPEKEDKK